MTRRISASESIEEQTSQGALAFAGGYPSDFDARQGIRPSPLVLRDLRVSTLGNEAVEIDLFQSIGEVPDSSLKLVTVVPPLGARVTLLGGGHVLFKPGAGQHRKADIRFQAVDFLGRQITHKVTVETLPVNKTPNVVGSADNLIARRVAFDPLPA